MKKTKAIVLLFTIILLTYSSSITNITRAAPLNIKNYGVGFGPLPIEVGMIGEITGAYTLQYDSPAETGFALFRLRTTTSIIFEQKFYEPTPYTEKNIQILISPDDWAPGENGQLAIVELDLIASNGTNTQYDNASVWFYVKRAGLKCIIKNISVYNKTEIFTTFELFNEHNINLKAYGILVSSRVYSNGTIISENITKTDKNGEFSLRFIPRENITSYNITITASSNEDYEGGEFNFRIPTTFFDEETVNISSNPLTFFEKDENNSININIDNSKLNYTEGECFFLENKYNFTLNNNSNFKLSITPPTAPGEYPIVVRLLNSTSEDYYIKTIQVMPRNLTLNKKINIENGILKVILNFIDTKTKEKIDGWGNLKVLLLDNNKWNLISDGKVSINDDVEIAINIASLGYLDAENIKLKIIFEKEGFLSFEGEYTVSLQQQKNPMNTFYVLFLGPIAGAGVSVIIFKRIKKGKDIEID